VKFRRKSEHEPFLQRWQKRFATPRVSIVQTASAAAARNNSAPAMIRRNCTLEIIQRLYRYLPGRLFDLGKRVAEEAKL
jgi:hypothetical protein